MITHNVNLDFNMHLSSQNPKLSPIITESPVNTCTKPMQLPAMQKLYDYWPLT